MESSTHAKRLLEDTLRSHPDCKLGSYDVVSLFTQVPIQEAISVVESFLRNDEDLGSRTVISVEILTTSNFALELLFFFRYQVFCTN